MADTNTVSEVVVTASKDGGFLNRPRFKINVGGVDLDGAISISLTETDDHNPDTFECCVALLADNDPNWWLSSKRQDVKIWFGVEDDDGVIDWGDPRFLGNVSHAKCRWDEAEIRIDGRDKTGLFMDRLSKGLKQNKTASEIVSDYAKAAGLKTDIVPTKRRVGALYAANNNAVNSKHRPQWDEMCELADLEGYRLKVETDTVVFRPLEPLEEAQVTYSIFAAKHRVDGNLASYDYLDEPHIATCLEIDHDTELAAGTGVIVRSFNTEHFATYTGKAGATSDDDNPYEFSYPGLTQAEVTDLAKRRLEEIEDHTYRIMWEEPGNTLLTTSDVVELYGTETVADQKYRIESIFREMSFEDGFTIRVTARNRQPATKGGNGD